MSAGRVRLLVASGLAGLLLAVAAVGWLGTRRPVTGVLRSPGLSSPAAASPAPSPILPPSPTVAIPDGVMMTPTDFDERANARDSDPSRWTRGNALLPRPCSEAGWPSDALRTGNRAVVSEVDARGDNLVTDEVVHYVATYSGSGARLFMTELTAAAGGCRETPWIAMGTIAVGEESVLFQVDVYGGVAGERHHPRFVAAFRVGRAIAVVASIGTMRDAGSAVRARTVAQRAAGRMSPIA